MQDPLIEITNLTDVPGPKKVTPQGVDIFRHTLAPGESILVPASKVDKKLHDLAGHGGLLGVGALPDWYVAAKSVGGGTLSQEEAIKRVKTAPLAKDETPKAEMVKDEKKSRK